MKILPQAVSEESDKNILVLLWPGTTASVTLCARNCMMQTWWIEWWTTWWITWWIAI